MDSLRHRIKHIATTVLSGGRPKSQPDVLAATIDPEYFRLQLAAAGIDPVVEDLVAFYKGNAAARALSPNPWFDEVFYRSKNPDVSSAIDEGNFLSGFDHFVHHGIREGRCPNLAFNQQMLGQIAWQEIGDPAQFDPDFYLLDYELVRQFLKSMPIVTPREFFNLYGRRMGHMPSVSKRGEGEGHASAVLQPWFHNINQELIFSEFDADHYRETYKHELGDMSPSTHYLHIGRKTGNSPNAGFDEMFYRTFYTDIGRAVASGKLSSGFEHYVLAGRKEGRIPKFELTRCLEQILPGLTQPVALANFLELERRLKPHRHRLVEEQPRTVWFFVPRLNPDLFFGGYSTLVHLAEAFLCRGIPIGFFLFEDTADSFNFFCYRSPNSELTRRKNEIALFSAFSEAPFLLGPDDVLIAYSAWQALAAGFYAKNLRSKKFVFLVQEYEAVFHGHDSAHFLVDMAYKKPHIALFNSVFLEKFFRQQGLGVFEKDKQSTDYITFEHVLTPVSPPSSLVLQARKTRRVIVYARPETHAQRNLTEICLIALREAIAKNIFGRDFEFIGVGALSGPHHVDLGWGRTLEICPKVDRDSYVELLQGADIGLSLMYAPHPSLIPYELANAGAIVVTNTFSNRSKLDIQARSPRLIPVDLSVDDIVAGLQEAVSKIGDIDLRTNPAYAVASPVSWQKVFDDLFIDELCKQLDNGMSEEGASDFVNELRA
ncbi:glycosyltransferase family 4 protein [Dyella tabacisoli]|nr:glycosyltransferase family 4 protein [Dyella tabacisoli]